MMRSHRRAAALLVAAMAVGAVAGCGGDDDTASADAADTTTRAPGDGAASPTTSGARDPAAARACPDAAPIGDAVGTPMVVDEHAPVRAQGFCSYVAATNPDSLAVTLTFTPLDITRDAGGEAVDGVGQAARWSSTTDELSVWTGDEGLIVMVSPSGIDLDRRQAAVDLATWLLRE
jgi:hypothetical protein